MAERRGGLKLSCLLYCKAGKWPLCLHEGMVAGGALLMVRQFAGPAHPMACQCAAAAAPWTDSRIGENMHKIPGKVYRIGRGT